MTARTWLVAARPKTLAAAVSPVLIGTALALRRSLHIHWFYFGCALVGAIFIQVATNLINDALDFRKGADTNERLGPLRVTQAGLLDAATVMRGAYVCLALAALAGVPLILRGGWPILVIGLASMLAAYAYTGGPYPLAYHGLGELFVLIFFGFVAVGGTYYVLTLQFAVEVAICGFAAGALAVVLLAINNLRDIAGDRSTNKRTVAVRIGEPAARVEIAFFALAPFASVAAAAALLQDWSLLLVMISLPLALALIRSVYRSTGASLNHCLAMAGVMQWAFSLLFLIGSCL